MWSNDIRSPKPLHFFRFKRHRNALCRHKKKFPSARFLSIQKTEEVYTYCLSLHKTAWIFPENRRAQYSLVLLMTEPVKLS